MTGIRWGMGYAIFSSSYTTAYCFIGTGNIFYNITYKRKYTSDKYKLFRLLLSFNL